MSQTTPTLAAGNVQANQPYPQGIGNLSASSISLTASNGVTPTRIAPIRLFNNLVELDVYTGNGAPTFSANTGSIYLRNDTALAYINTSASPGGTTWDQFPTLAGNQTFTGNNTFTKTLVDTNTTLSFQGSGPIEAVRGGGSTTTYAMLGFDTNAGGAAQSAAHDVFNSVNVSPSTTSTVTLSGDAVYVNNIQMVAVADGATPANAVTCVTISLTQFSLHNNDAGATRTCRYHVMGD